MVGVALLFASASFAQQVKTTTIAAQISASTKRTPGKRSNSRPLWVAGSKKQSPAALTAKGLTPVESGGDIAVVAIEMTKINKLSHFL